MNVNICRTLGPVLWQLRLGDIVVLSILFLVGLCRVCVVSNTCILSMFFTVDSQTVALAVICLHAKISPANSHVWSIIELTKRKLKTKRTQPECLCFKLYNNITIKCYMIFPCLSRGIISGPDSKCSYCRSQLKISRLR
jgi:hypothetical protein